MKSLALRFRSRALGIIILLKALCLFSRAERIAPVGCPRTTMQPAHQNKQCEKWHCCWALVRVYRAVLWLLYIYDAFCSHWLCSSAIHLKLVCSARATRGSALAVAHRDRGPIDDGSETHSSQLASRGGTDQQGTPPLLTRCFFGTGSAQLPC